MKDGRYDVVVIGGGHAGVEACHAAARMGAKTLLLTMEREAIARASCNPAIGGLAKGQIVREIDALGGVMGLATDAAGIQFRLLNRSKGPAVQSPRAQIDKYEYSRFVCEYLDGVENLVIEEGMVEEILTEAGRVTGVRLEDGREFGAGSVVVTTGTFLRGMMHIGDEQFAGGRLDERASVGLSECLERLGLELGRLKTGTPVRLAGDSIDYNVVEEQPGDENPEGFSFLHDRIKTEQVPCWITYTNPAIHDLLMANLDRAPLYTGQIQSTGPRYCPSIETKVMRFPDRERHQVFLEPEDREVRTIYANGISTSVPRDVQEQMLRLLPGTERARIVHYAYAMEYDYVPASQLGIDLQTRKVAGLFLAGQINGTSGYEEAGAQGLIAGVNAVCCIEKRDPLVLGRDQAYIGVLVDDLLTRDIVEPYRMFTSRAEYRLSLRSDNADQRLTRMGREFGVVDDRRWRHFEQKEQKLGELIGFLQKTRRGGQSLWEKLKVPGDAFIEGIFSDGEVRALGAGDAVLRCAVIEAKYEGYLRRQDKQIEGFRKLENVNLPGDLDYNEVPHLRAEAKERLGHFMPATLGQASRIGGITPADIAVIQIYLRKKSG